MTTPRSTWSPPKPKHLGCGGSLVAYVHYVQTKKHPLVWNGIEWTHNSRKILALSEDEQDENADIAIDCAKCHERVFDDISWVNP